MATTFVVNKVNAKLSGGGGSTGTPTTTSSGSTSTGECARVMAYPRAPERFSRILQGGGLVCARRRSTVNVAGESSIIELLVRAGF